MSTAAVPVAAWTPPRMSLPAAVRALWAPPPHLAPSEWAEKYRHLPESSAARGALWSNGTQPALTGIMDAAVEPGVRELTLVKAAQCGGSETIGNLLGYLIHLAPCPVLLAHPTYDGVTEWLKETFDDVVRSTPELRARVRDRRAPRGAHQGESTISLKRFPGGYLAGVGGNSPNAYARRSCRVVIADDASRLPASVGEEGDPASLLRQRTQTWPDSLCVFVSTPTVVDDIIDQAWQRSDQRRYHLTCRACGLEEYVTWNDPRRFRVVYEGEDPETAQLACPCGARYGEGGRRELVHGGRWIATAQGQPGSAGFHLPRTISILGNATLANLVAGWLAARKEGREALRAWVNTALGEPWEDRDSPKLEPHVLMGRRERYDPEELPAAAAVLTAGVDVQANRLELQVVAWGERLERWVVAYETIAGDPRRRETWEELSRRLAAPLKHPTGHSLTIHATCVDSGYLADEVYGFALANQHRRIVATKGESHGTVEPLFMRFAERTFGKNARPVRLGRLNVDAGKAELSAALGLSPGKPGDAHPGAVHFGDFLGEDYFVQLTSEHRERYYVRGVAHERWTKREGARNEAWDTLIYARAAFDALCVLARRQHDVIVRQFAAELKAKPPAPGGPAPAPAVVGPAQAPAPRSRTSGWSGGMGKLGRDGGGGSSW